MAVPALARSPPACLRAFIAGNFPAHHASKVLIESFRGAFWVLVHCVCSVRVGFAGEGVCCTQTRPRGFYTAVVRTYDLPYA